MKNGSHRGRPPLIFIASLGRSGSTLLDLLLGANPEMVGLGEVWKTLRLAGEDQHACTCGAPGLECPVWGAILSFMQLGYEELCFRPEFMLGKICDFAAVPFDAEMLSPTTSNSHILRGNPMRWSASRRKAIVYPNRWFYRPTIQMLAAALPFVFSGNTDNVYRNIGPATLRPHEGRA